MRALLLLLVAIASASCATPGLLLGRTTCAEDEAGALLFCDERGRLVTCAGETPIVAKDGIHACVDIDGADFLVTCDASQGRAHAAELVPCAACDVTGEGPELVTLAAAQCVLGAPPDEDAAAPGLRVADACGGCAEGSVCLEGDEPRCVPACDVAEADPCGEGATCVEGACVEAGTLYQGCPCDEGLVCQPEFGVCVEPRLCDPFAETVCPEGEVCALDEDPPICVPAPEETGAI